MLWSFDSPNPHNADVPAYPLSFSVFSAPSPTLSLLLHDLLASLFPANHSASVAYSSPYVPPYIACLLVVQKRPKSAQPTASKSLPFHLVPPFSTCSSRSLQLGIARIVTTTTSHQGGLHHPSDQLPSSQHLTCQDLALKCVQKVSFPKL